MADVNVKMGVTGISQLKQGMSDAQASVKTLDAALKANEKQLKATGDAENFLQGQTSLLNQKMQAQRDIVKNAEAALKKMRESGIRESSKSFQDMQRKLIEAQSAILDTQMELDNLGSHAAEAAGETDKLQTSLGGINKKLSLDQVIGGIDSITNALEKAGQKAIDLGETVFNAVMDKAKWADDTATMAEMYEIPLERFLQMQKLVKNGMDTSVDSMLSSMDKMNKNVGKGTKETMEALSELGLVMTSTGKNGEVFEQLVTEDSMDLFFRAGKAINEMGKGFDKEASAQAIFGRSWKELVPLFDKYKTVEEYNAALDNTKTNTEEEVTALAELNDKMSELEGNLDTLATSVLASLAPALTTAADALNGLLEKVLAYLKTDDGQKMLDNLATAVSGLFEDLGKIDPQTVVEGFTGVMDKVIGGVQWLVENKDSVIDALKAIVIGWGALKLTGGALQILNLLNGLSGLLGKGGSAVASGASAAASGGGEAAGAGIVGKIGAALGGGNLAIGGAVAAQAGLAGYSVYGLARVFKALFFGGEEMDDKYYEDNLAHIREDIEAHGGFYEDDALPIPVEPDPVPDSVEMIVKRIGTVDLPVNLVPQDNRSGGGTGIGSMEAKFYANGLPYVPFDGYTAVLHKGEQVVPAREVNSSRNFSSNLYVESMYMNNGMDAEGLAASIAAANRRTMRGFGS